MYPDSHDESKFSTPSKGQPLREKLSAKSRQTPSSKPPSRSSLSKGLHAAKMETIAERAGVAVGPLYNHFEDRNALLAALVEERRVALVGELDSSLATYKGEPFELGLSDFITAFIYYCEARVSLVALMVRGRAFARAAQTKGGRAGSDRAADSRAGEARDPLESGRRGPRADALPDLVLGSMLKAALEDSRVRPQTEPARPKSGRADVTAGAARNDSCRAV